MCSNVDRKREDKPTGIRKYFLTKVIMTNKNVLKNKKLCKILIKNNNKQ